MKNPELYAEVLEHGEFLLAGEFDKIIPSYQEVLPIFVEGKAILIEGHDALREALKNLRDRLLSEGVVRCVGTITSGAQTEQGRFHFAIDWNYHIGLLKAPKISSAVYYCVREGGRSKVEMVEYKKLAFPNITGWNRFDMITPRKNSYATSGYLH